VIGRVWEIYKRQLVTLVVAAALYRFSSEVCRDAPGLAGLSRT
jgi:hypothetical protein